MSQYPPNNNNQHQGGYGRNYPPRRNNYDWLVQQRIRLELEVQKLLAQLDYWQNRSQSLQAQRGHITANKFGLSIAVGISVLQGHRAPFMAERRFLYQNSRLDQEEERAQKEGEWLASQIVVVQEQLETITFELNLLSNPPQP